MKINCAYTELVDINKLSTHPKNANKHSEQQIDLLTKLIQYQGFRHPIIVSKLSGFIVAGHARLQVALKLKYPQVPVDYQDFDNEDQEYAFLVSDNTIQELAETDLSLVNLHSMNLGPDFDLELLGIPDFVVEPLDKLDPQTDEDSVPEKVPTKSVLGDVYEIGNHRLMCGDSTFIDSVDKLMNGEKADITFTSPPYNAGKKGYENGNSKYQNSDDNNETEWLELMNKFTPLAIEFSKYSFINVQWLYSNKIPFIEWLSNFKDMLVQDIIWAKPTMPSINENCLNSDHEYIFVFNKENKNRKIHLKKFHGTLSSWFKGNRSNNREFAKIHRATFNVSLPEKFINDFGAESCIDFFGGTGSTLIACEKTNTKCFMMELDPFYCDVIVTRWCKYTGINKIKRNGEEIIWEMN